MFRNFIRKNNSWLLPLMLILFILEVFTFPFVVDVTYSGRSESPDNVLTYTENRLIWDSSTNINPNGSAELSLFDIAYGGAKSHNEDDIVAPGTEGNSIIRLKNSVNRRIQYTAVLYERVTDKNLPVKVSLAEGDFLSTNKYSLPDDLEDVKVIKAVKGSLNKKNIQDFDISWVWDFHKSKQQDIVDTTLGNKENLDEIMVGLYITVTDNGGHDDEEDRPGGGGIVIIPPKDPEPDEPDQPDVPDLPDDPDNPDVPDNPDQPDIPDLPDDPDVPSDPDMPTDPDQPGQPQDPDNPDEPSGETGGESGDIGVGDKDKPGKDDGVIKPEVPKTGDTRLFDMYITLMIISGLILILLIFEKRKEKK